MNSLSDQQLLRDYAESRSDAAFGELVRRQVDFVYSAALRMVRDAHLAEDVTQSVFMALAQNARQLASHPVLAGWLHRTTQNLAANTVRSEVRRRNREQESVAMNELLASEPDVAWECIQPHLDHALGELSEADRDALLLRFFQRKSAREMAQALGVSDEAAQKRVNRAVERLRELFSKRGITVGASGLLIILSANAVQAAPIGLSAAVSATATLAGTVTTTTTATISKTIAMTTLQKTLVTVAFMAAVGAGLYEAQQALRAQKEIAALRQQQSPLAGQLAELRRQQEKTTNELAALAQENETLRRNNAELPRLRGEVARSRGDAQELAQLKAGNTNTSDDPAQAEMKSWLTRVNLLKQRLEQSPDKKIPELALLTDQDWLSAARGKLETEQDFRRAMSSARGAGENKFAGLLQPALRKYLEANNQQFPTDMSQLQPYFKSPVDPAMLERYAILPSYEIPSLGMGGKWIISQRSPVDEEYDSRTGIGPYGSGSTGSQSWNDATGKVVKTLEPVMKAYAAANGGGEPSDPTQLLPYLKTPEQKTAYDRAVKFLNASKKAEAK